MIRDLTSENEFKALRLSFRGIPTSQSKFIHNIYYTNVRVLMKTLLQIHCFHKLDLLAIKVHIGQTCLLLQLNNGRQLMPLRQLLYMDQILPHTPECNIIELLIICLHD